MITKSNKMSVLLFLEAYTTLFIVFLFYLTVMIAMKNK